MKITTTMTGRGDNRRYSGKLRSLLLSGSLVMIPVSAALALEAQGTVSEPEDPAPVAFNSAFVHGSTIDVSRFSTGNPVAPGLTTVTARVNGALRGKYQVLFIPIAGSDIAQPCFRSDELLRLGIKVPDGKSRPAGSAADDQQCQLLKNWIDGASTRYDSADFELELSVPQLYLVSYPEGYTDPASWDAGMPALFLDYNTNFYTQQFSKGYSGGLGHTASGSLGLLSGINAYGWRLRNRSTTYLSSRSESGTRNLSTWLQRDIPPLKSQLTLGETNTSGDLFDSLSFRGIQLASDDRMLPESLRQYTPVLQGIAETNARVQVTQRGQLIYETTVPPGPFELNNVSAMGYGGDLQMTIIEADGQRYTRIIPFSAPPMLLHPGVSRYSIAVGELDESGLQKKPMMATGFYQYGMNNYYTLYTGGQFSNDYYSAALGQSFNTPLGGISMDITRAWTQLSNNKSSSGNSFNLGYSKFIEPTSTNISMTAYRYSSKGFYSLRDATAERYGISQDYYMIDYRTKQRLAVNVAQTLPLDSRLVLAGNFYQYWNNRSATSQYSLYFSKNERLFSWAAGISRVFSTNGKTSNNYTLSMTIPLSRRLNISDKPLFNSLSTMMTRSSDGATSLVTNATGTRGDRGTLSYGMGTSTSRAREGGTDYAVNGNLNYNTPFGQFGSTLSVGNRSRQFSASNSGSLVLHSGGLTLGPSLGDAPFAVVNAPGAAGAKIRNGYGTTIDRNGYAIVPSLTPYRENSVSVDTKGLPDTVELLENEQAVIPRMGAAVGVKIKTRAGKPVLFIIRDSQGSYIPIGSEITLANGEPQAVVGQAGMAFLRGWNIGEEPLYIRGGEGKSQCSIPTNSALATRISQSPDNTIIREEVVCK